VIEVTDNATAPDKAQGSQRTLVPHNNGGQLPRLLSFCKEKVNCTRPIRGLIVPLIFRQAF
jgi:hypothetical protein